MNSDQQFSVTLHVINHKVYWDGEQPHAPGATYLLKIDTRLDPTTAEATIRLAFTPRNLLRLAQSHLTPAIRVVSTVV